MPDEKPSFQLCPSVTQPGEKITAGYQLESSVLGVPPDGSLKRAEARRLWARFLVRSAQSATMREGLKETA